jgi:hypothetical protein
MRFMIMFKTDAENEADAPACMVLPEMQRFIGELRDQGVLLGTEGLKPSTFNAARVSRSGGRFTLTDGPFAEAKELVAGFVLLELPSKQAALDLAEQFLTIAGQGWAEVREVFAPHEAIH